MRGNIFARGKYYDERMRFVIPPRAEHCEFIGCISSPYGTIFFFYHIRKMIYLQPLCPLFPITYHLAFDIRKIHQSWKIYRVFTRASDIDAGCCAQRCFLVAFISFWVAHPIVCTLALQIRVSSTATVFRLIKFFSVFSSSIVALVCSNRCHGDLSRIEYQSNISLNWLRPHDRRSFRVNHSTCAVNRACNPRSYASGI